MGTITFIICAAISLYSFQFSRALQRYEQATGISRDALLPYLPWGVTLLVPAQLVGAGVLIAKALSGSFAESAWLFGASFAVHVFWPIDYAQVLAEPLRKARAATAEVQPDPQRVGEPDAGANDSEYDEVGPSNAGTTPSSTPWTITRDSGEAREVSTDELVALVHEGKVRASSAVRYLDGPWEPAGNSRVLLAELRASGVSFRRNY